MSNTLHIVTKHVVEYGNSGFNWQHNEMHKLLRDKGCHINETLNEDAVGDWEIDEFEFKAAVRKIKRMPVDKLKSYFPDFRKEDDGKTFKKHVVRVLDEFVNTGDCSNGYYHFSWF